MSLVKFSVELEVQDERQRNPRSFLRVVSLSIHEVLITSAIMANIQEPTNQVGRIVIDSPGRWRGFGRRAHRVGRDWFQL